MIEINISESAAAYMLHQRMKLELRFNIKAKLIPYGYRLEYLSFKELKRILDASVFDLVMMLPANVHNEENNLAEIITGAVRQLAKIIGREEFKLFDIVNARTLLSPIPPVFKIAHEDDKFTCN